jgi:hypothetical protein
VYYVALIDITNKRIALAEKYKDKAVRDKRASHLELQAEMNEKGLNDDEPAGSEWRVAPTDDAPFQFEKE